MTRNSFRDKLSPEDRAAYDEMTAAHDAHREHNRAAMEAAGVPRPAVRGINRATSYGAERISEIKEHPRTSWRDGKPLASTWVVVTGDSTWTRRAYIIGPRGACKRVSG